MVLDFLMAHYRQRLEEEFLNQDGFIGAERGHQIIFGVTPAILELPITMIAVAVIMQHGLRA